MKRTEGLLTYYHAFHGKAPLGSREPTRTTCNGIYFRGGKDTWCRCRFKRSDNCRKDDACLPCELTKPGFSVCSGVYRKVKLELVSTRLVGISLAVDRGYSCERKTWLVGILSLYFTKKGTSVCAIAGTASVTIRNIAAADK